LEIEDEDRCTRSGIESGRGMKSIELICAFLGRAAASEDF
jgi:hypothetical protein